MDIKMNRRLAITLICIVFAMISSRALACTLWGASGDAVAGGGSLIVKNRDWVPDHYQELRLVTPAWGNRYYGLFAVYGDNKKMKAGINEKGLVVVSATAGSIPKKDRQKMEYMPALSAKLLIECASVEEAVTKTELFLGPQILMLADSKRIATIEIGPDRHYSVTQQENGALTHTNHYLDDQMLEFNRSIGTSSKIRHQRINELLHNINKPYDLDTFIDISRDQNDGPDNSIFRTGSTPKKPRTMAVYAVALPPDKAPVLYVSFHHPGQDEQVVRINPEDFF